MELRLKTITPLHIGNGDDLHALDYVILQNRFYRVSQRLFQVFLEDMDNAVIQQFADWTLDIADKIEYNEQGKRRAGRHEKRDFNQQLSHLRKQFNYLAFAKEVGQEQAFIAFLKDNAPSISISNPRAQKQQVRGMIKTGQGSSYLPGSSLKGAIRTAMTYHVLEHHIPTEEVQLHLEKAMNQAYQKKREAESRNRRFRKDFIAKNFAESLTHLVSYCGIETEKGIKPNDEKYDLFKLLLIADGHTNASKESVENIDTYLVTKEKNRRTDKMETVATKQSQTPRVEAIALAEDITSHINFNIEFLLEIKPHVKDDKIKGKPYAHWIGIATKVKQLFGIDIQQLTKANKEEQRKAAIHHILSCVRRFSQRQLEADAKWLRNFVGNDKGRQFSKAIELGYQRVLNHQNANRIHLGFGSGFGGTTAYYYFLAHLPEHLKEIMEFFGIGDKPGADRRRKPGQVYTANPTNFPKSKRLITRQDEIMPLGWLEIVNGPAVPESERPKLVTVSKTGAKSGKAALPEGPRYPRGKLKARVELDAEILAVGKPNKIKLFLDKDKTQEITVSYGMGFDKDKIGSLIVVRIGNINKKGQVLSVNFKGFR